jgi:hypothetical protein
VAVVAISPASALVAVVEVVVAAMAVVAPRPLTAAGSFLFVLETMYWFMLLLNVQGAEI